MANPKSKVSEVDPGVPSRKRQAPETSTSAKKKHKVDRPSQGANRNLTEVTREDTPGFDEFQEKDDFMFHIGDKDEEDDTDPEDDEDDLETEYEADEFTFEDEVTDSELGDNNFHSNLESRIPTSNFEKDNNKSNLKKNVPSNTIEPKRKRETWMTSLILNPANRNFAPESDIDDLNGLRYCKLKRMRTDPTARAQYGDEALINACRKANFSRMTLDQLYILPRERIPKKHHGILDDVIHTKELAVDNELDEFAYDAYYPDRIFLPFTKHWRVTEYLDALRSQAPGPRYH